MKEDDSRSRLGATLRNLRQRRGWTLAELGRRCGFSVPTLSKVENDRLSLSYDKLIRLSEGLGVDIGELFVPVDVAGGGAVTGRRSVNRRDEGELVATRNYDYRYLSTDVSRKKFIPILTEPHARSIEEFGELVRHSGDEFVLVVEGEIEVYTEFYEPIILRTGESLYIDSSMGHAYIARGKGPCRIIGICSASEQDLREATKAEVREPTSLRQRSTTKSRRGPRSRST
jgi:transcriptional regulator with XRE-family HTH domain